MPGYLYFLRLARALTQRNVQFIYTRWAAALAARLAKAEYISIRSDSERFRATRVRHPRDRAAIASAIRAHFQKQRSNFLIRLRYGYGLATAAFAVELRGLQPIHVLHVHSSRRAAGQHVIKLASIDSVTRDGIGLVRLKRDERIPSRAECVLRHALNRQLSAQRWHRGWRRRIDGRLNRGLGVLRWRGLRCTRRL
jgi:hypothetical protein